MATAVIRAIDQQAVNASGAHFSEGDLLLAREFGHAPLPRRYSLTDLLDALTGCAVFLRWQWKKANQFASQEVCRSLWWLQ
jgi:hypothetical protein